MLYACSIQLDTPYSDGLEWHHLAVTFDADTCGLEIFLDGTSDYSTTVSSYYCYPIPGGGSLYLGHFSFSLSHSFSLSLLYGHGNMLMYCM